MNFNKILIGGLVGAVAFFALGFVIYGLLLEEFMKANMNQCVMKPMEEMVWWAMIVSNLAYGLLMAVIIGMDKAPSLMSGLKIGATVGLLMGISMDAGFYAMSTMYNDLTAIGVDIACYTVLTGIGGAVIGAVMGMGKPAA